METPKTLFESIQKAILAFYNYFAEKLSAKGVALQNNSEFEKVRVFSSYNTQLSPGAYEIYLVAKTNGIDPRFFKVCMLDEKRCTLKFGFNLSNEKGSFITLASLQTGCLEIEEVLDVIATFLKGEIIDDQISRLAFVEKIMNKEKLTII